MSAHQHRKAQPHAAPVGIHGPELDAELMLSGLAVADQLPGSGVEVLFPDPDALPEGRRRRGVEDPEPRARPRGNLDSAEPGASLTGAGAYRPDLARRERIGLDGFVTVELGGSHELLGAVRSHGVAEDCEYWRGDHRSGLTAGGAPGRHPAAVVDQVGGHGRQQPLLGRARLLQGQLYPAVPGLFDLVADAYRRADDVRVTSDPTYGYPASVDVDWLDDAIDDEVTVLVSDLRQALQVEAGSTLKP